MPQMNSVDSGKHSVYHAKIVKTKETEFLEHLESLLSELSESVNQLNDMSISYDIHGISKLWDVYRLATAASFRAASIESVTRRIRAEAKNDLKLVKDHYQYEYDELVSDSRRDRKLDTMSFNERESIYRLKLRDQHKALAEVESIINLTFAVCERIALLCRLITSLRFDYKAQIDIINRAESLKEIS